MEDVHCGSKPIATAYMQIANMTAQAGSSSSTRHSTGPILHQLDKKWDWVMPAAKPDDIANVLFSWWRMEHVPESELWHDTLNCFLRWTAHNKPDGCVTPADVAKVMRSLETSRSYRQTTGSLNNNISPMAVSEAAVQLVRHMYNILQLEKYSGPNKQPRHVQAVFLCCKQFGLSLDTAMLGFFKQQYTAVWEQKLLRQQRWRELVQQQSRSSHHEHG